MLIRLNTGIVAKGLELHTGDIVDWQSDADCERFIERGIAVAASAADAKSERVRAYAPPKPTAADND